MKISTKNSEKVWSDAYSALKKNTKKTTVCGFHVWVTPEIEFDTKRVIKKKLTKSDYMKEIDRLRYVLSEIKNQKPYKVFKFLKILK